jgi:alpha-N-arabinofuranosidase
MAHYAQTVNVIGAVKTSKTTAEMETTGLVLQMYRAHYGQTPLTVSEAPAPYDVTAALGAGEKTLTVGVVNPTKEELVLKVQLAGAALGASGMRWTVAGTDEQQHNTPGQPRAVDIQQVEAPVSALKVPALSATVFELPLK